MFELPELPFEKNSLAPWTSEETINFHYGKHHAGYVNKLNAAVLGKEFEGKELNEVIRESRESHQKIYNLAAQHYNHSFFWSCLKAESSMPDEKLMKEIENSFESFETFKEEFTKTAATHFGSGWAWLVKTKEGSLVIKGFHDADTPAQTDDMPLLTLDVWEHAYYIDHRNDRSAFIDGFWDHVNWSYVSSQLQA